MMPSLPRVYGFNCKMHLLAPSGGGLPLCKLSFVFDFSFTGPCLYNSRRSSSAGARPWRRLSSSRQRRSRWGPRGPEPTPCPLPPPRRQPLPSRPLPRKRRRRSSAASSRRSEGDQIVAFVYNQSERFFLVFFLVLLIFFGITGFPPFFI